jgi:hypothetical protein
MKIVRDHVRTVLSIAFCFHLFAITAHAHASAVQVEGENFRASIDAAFKAQKTFQRFHDVTDVCRNARLEGKTVDYVNRLLHAAGQKFDLQRASGSTARPDDLVGGFGLVSGLTYGSALTIILQAPFPAKDGPRTVASVRQCLIVSTSS